ncbi:MAG: EAL domain-containing protein [Sulfurimicrobium sp.]|nr:EAL domain-containing protein [Sulfurimicrobium sp.]MDP2199407.1 EAL domain-containing protein [Sulfurimicrobium sp.]MDP3687914.1 EAL domain-containing protein [Sulfurimicrobium sp.]
MSKKSRTQELRDKQAGIQTEPQMPLKNTFSRPPEELPHELQTHQAELEKQNTELRNAQTALEESRDHFVDLYDFAPIGYITLNPTALIMEINLTGAAMLGEERKKLLRRRFARFVAAEDSDRWYRNFLGVALHGDNQSCEVTLQRMDGTRLQVRLDCLRQVKEGKEPLVHIALSDITAHKLAEEELRITSIAFDSQQGIMVTDPNGVIIRVNQAFTDLTGYSAEEVTNKTPAVLKSGLQNRTFYQDMWKTLIQNRYWQGQMWNRHKNGKIYAEWLTISAVTAPNGRVTHYVGIFSDITRNQEIEAEIHRLAYYDPLTLLPNRRLFRDRLGQSITATTRNGHCGALLFLDMDNFKILNDTRGHDIGDLLLVEVAQRLLACVRAGDTVARLGGDEFVILLEDLSKELEEAAAQTKALCEKVQNLLAEPYHLKDYEYHCTTSIGVCLFNSNNNSVEELLKHADFAMYQSKNAGRNTLRFFDPAMQAALDERSTLVNDLRQALERQEFRLYYQPQLESTPNLIFAEALLRWAHPERGVLTPGEFIPLAEETGLILPIGLWVLETACAQLKAWESNLHSRELRLTINVSAYQFRHPDFVTQVQEVLARSGANPTRLRIELTDNLALDKVTDALEKMHALKSLGIGFSLDNFGAGYSSLSYLTRLPLDQLKIDQEFIHALGSTPNAAAIVQSIVNLGQNLGLNVIAEGVETEAQRDFLEKNGCHAFQGFLYSQPLPLEEFERFLNPG